METENQIRKKIRDVSAKALKDYDETEKVKKSVLSLVDDMHAFHEILEKREEAFVKEVL